MNDEDGLELLDPEHNIVLVRYTGPHSLREGVATVTQSIAAAVARGAHGLIVDLRKIEGIEPPSVGTRHEFMRNWAGEAQGRVCLALVVRPEFIDPEKFAVIAAHNFGLTANVFETQAEALYWMRSETLLDD
jgi:hypothetical protein